MNFPDTQKTGAIAELDVQRIFVSWGWNCGRDLIDEGYDLCVTPDRNTYRGARFLVQVKGTSTIKKGTPRAPVSKDRLRQYAVNPLPVFIIRVTHEGEIYWVHAQEWSRENYNKINGSGTTTVTFTPSQNVQDRIKFEEKLSSIFNTLPNEINVPSYLQEEYKLLNSIDKRIGVRIQKNGDRIQHEIYAKEKFSGIIEIKPKKESLGSNPTQNLHDAIDYGLPRTIEVDHASITGSPVFDTIIGTKLAGELSISSAPSPGVVRLIPGKKFSVLSIPLALSANLYYGTRGLAISNETKKDVLKFELKAPNTERLNEKIQVNINLDPSIILNEPIQNHDQLAHILRWAEQVQRDKNVSLEIDFPEGKHRINTISHISENFDKALNWMQLMGKLHLIAKAHNSDFILSGDLPLLPEEARTINGAYELLSGEQCRMNLDAPIRVKFSEPLPQFQAEHFRLSSLFSIDLQGQVIGTFPIIITLNNYDIECTEDRRSISLIKKQNGEAWMQYHEV